jgi:creatinine amidohydrolase
MDEIRLLDLPHDEARRVLATGAPVHVFINPVEYHGPHLPLHNDHLVSRGLAGALHERLSRHQWPFIVATDLEIGVEPCGGVGSRHAPFEVARAIIREACRALAELGAQRVLLHTFHGAPLHNVAIEAGVELLREANVRVVAPFNAVLRELLEVDPQVYVEAFTHIDDPNERAEMMRELHLDFHGGFFETSMTMHFAPQSVSPRHRDLPPCPPIRPHVLATNAARVAKLVGQDVLAKELGFAAFGLGWQALDPFPGYTGRPHRATRESGAVFARHIVDAYELLVESVLIGDARSPPPIMSWVATLTANGRLSPSAP